MIKYGRRFIPDHLNYGIADITILLASNFKNIPCGTELREE
jgi:hypothetical protein